MFTIKDVWDVLNFLKSNESNGLDNALKITSQAEKTKATTLFTETIDQMAFNSDDYQRLRSFLIDWYSTFRTFTSIQQQVSDPYALTNTQLNELMLSFGYKYGHAITDQKTRINFFLDLVNLYKIKGTPLCLQKALGYYGLHDSGVAEYWLLKDSNGNLVFRGYSVFPGLITSPWSDLDYDLTIANDPHWMLTKEQVLAAAEQNPIAFPSKTPYFGVRPVFDFSKIDVLVSWFFKILYAQYNQFQINGSLTENIVLTNINSTVSLLECYLACVYVYNLNYNNLHINTVKPSILFYNGTATSATSALNEYNDLMTRPTSRDDRDTKLYSLYNLFTRNISYNFIPNQSDVVTLLDRINLVTKNNLRSSLDTWLASSKSIDLVASLLQDLSGWLRTNIETIFPDVFSNVLGLNSYVDITEIIRTFKPYRARVITSQYSFIFNKPVYEYFSLEDNEHTFKMLPVELFYDYDTASGQPCIGSILDVNAYADESSLDDAMITYARDMFDCGANLDVGLSDDKNEFSIPVQHDYIRDILNYHNSTAYIETEYVTDIDTGDVNFSRQVAGFDSFDSGYVLDVPFLNDICEVYVQTTIEFAYNWTEMRQAHNDRLLPYGISSYEGDFYIGGGDFDSYGQPMNDFWKYTNATTEWSQLSDSIVDTEEACGVLSFEYGTLSVAVVQIAVVEEEYVHMLIIYEYYDNTTWIVYDTVYIHRQTGNNIGDYGMGTVVMETSDVSGPLCLYIICPGSYMALYNINDKVLSYLSMVPSVDDQYITRPNIFKIDTMLYLAGGQTYNNTSVLPYVFSYNLLTDVWTRKSDLPVTFNRIKPLSFSTNGKGYLIGGTSLDIGT
jgi:hypothetical protein